jgi:hypothetical protein
MCVCVCVFTSFKHVYIGTLSDMSIGRGQVIYMALEGLIKALKGIIKALQDLIWPLRALFKPVCNGLIWPFRALLKPFRALYGL